MASGSLGDSNDDLNWRGRCRWTENCKVYTRKSHKKAQKTCNNNDTAIPSISIVEKPQSATLSPSRNQAPSSDEVTPATTAGAEVSPASEPATIPSSTATPNGTADGCASVGVVGTGDADSCQDLPEHSPQQEQRLPNGSPDKKAESSCLGPSLEQKESPHVPSVAEDSCRTDGSPDKKAEHSPQQEQRLPNGSPDKKAESSCLGLSLEQKESPHVPSVAEDSCRTDDRVEEGRDCQSAELQDPEDSQLPDSDEAKDLEKARSPDGGEKNEFAQRSESSPSRENDLPNGSVVTAARPRNGDDEQNDGMMTNSDQLSQGNGQSKVNGVVKSPPQVSKEQLAVVEAQEAQEMMPGSPQVSEGNGRGNANGVVKPLVISSIDDRIRFNLCKATPKNEIKMLRKNLEYELDQVRTLVNQLQSKELQLASHNTQISNSKLSNKSTFISAEGANASEYIHPQPSHPRSNVVDRRLLLRVNSEVGAMGHQETRPLGLARVNSDMGAARNLEPRVYSRQLSVAVTDNRSNEFIEKEKRTPKANQYYRNSEFLLGKDRLPSESNKRLKTSNGRKHSGETDHSMGYGYRYDKNSNHVFKNCDSLLGRLMKHKYGWVFNEPVNAKALGLVDYHDIIKHPMDLGTIKTRLSQKFYKSPREFADDVRLTFHNAMTYNPKGQDVHVMAEELLQKFEERWGIIEAEYNSYWKYPVYPDGGLHTPTSRKGAPYSHFGPGSVSAPAPAHTSAASIPIYASLAPGRTSDRPEPMSFMTVDQKMHRPHGGRTPAPKKPKAKDPNKRDMTYEEKQRLSTNLQGLPPEKLDAIVQIIKKRNTALSQHDDEIEVDIDSVDAETLWELDRFVTNYKKSLSKNKRKAELALQGRTVGNHNVKLTNSTPPVPNHLESGTAFKKGATLIDEDKEGNNGSRSSSSSSSSSDSGSSSSDSDSDSSSADGSDAGNSPKT